MRMGLRTEVYVGGKKERFVYWMGVLGPTIGFGFERDSSMALARKVEMEEMW